MGDVSGMRCRICLVDVDAGTCDVVSPCECNGSMQTVHKKCLSQWMRHRNSKFCEICRSEYKNVILVPASFLPYTSFLTDNPRAVVQITWLALTLLYSHLFVSVGIIEPGVLWRTFLDLKKTRDVTFFLVGHITCLIVISTVWLHTLWAHMTEFLKWRHESGTVYDLL